MVLKERSLKSRVSFIGIGQLFNAFINILLLPYLARSLEVEVYGTYGQVLLVCGIFQAIFAFGLPKLIFNYLNKKAEDTTTNFVTNSLFSCIILSLLSILILIAANEYIAQFMKNKALAKLLNIYALSILFNLCSSVLISILNHFHKVASISAVAIINNLLRVGVIISLIQLSYDLEAIFTGLLIVSILQFIILFILSPIPLFAGKIQLDFIKKILSKGLPLSLSGITTILLVQTDGIMISSLIDTAAYAIYRMGAIPIPFLFIIYSSVITITMADVNKFFHAGAYDKILSLKRKTSFSIAALTYPALIFILIFAKEVIDIYLGDQYHGSLWVFVIYNFLLFLRITDYRDILIAAGKTKVILISDVSIFIFNIISNYILISYFGIEGAVIASILSYYILSFVLQYQAAKQINANIFAFFEFKKMGQVFILALVLSVFAYLAFQFFDYNYYLIPLLVILYFILTYFLMVKLKVISIQQLVEISSRHKILSPVNYFLKRL